MLETGGSPSALRARERFARYCLLGARPQEALAEFDRLEPLAESAHYSSLLARIHWLEALAFSDRGDFERSLAHYQHARDIYNKTRDAEGEAAVVTRRAFVLQAAGDGRSAWRERIQGLALLDQVRQPIRRAAALFDVANACRHQRLMRCALQVQSAVVEAVGKQAICPRWWTISLGAVPSMAQSCGSRRLRTSKKLEATCLG